MEITFCGICVFFGLNRDWKRSPLLSRERGWGGLLGGEPEQAAVQSFRWATNGSVSHHFSILAAEKLFLPLVWWRPPFIWCNWEAKRSSVASAISQPLPHPRPLILLRHLFASASNSSSCSKK